MVREQAKSTGTEQSGYDLTRISLLAGRLVVKLSRQVLRER
ncbi:hypothetical protein CEV33_4758 [Brucella grignonensis]|uniref:Uncharacterized protein n=1 Tax=Brucella grignonensis TaxID=94627 RepID=A0A256G312_9HYPH|nr:hypothetical protein CEV33_4758 [Brucella grignonensis]